MFVGYRGYDQDAIAPRFAHGTGLSDTSFAYSNLEVAHGAASFTMKNTGVRAGVAVPQVYIGRLPVAVPTPPGRTPAWRGRTWLPGRAAASPC